MPAVATARRPMSRRALRALQVTWYRKIREIDPEWRDVERNVDLNRYPGYWTLSPEHVAFGVGDESIALAENETYQYWARIRHAAYALPNDDKYRPFLVACAERGEITQLATITKFGLTPRRARTVWRKFLQKTAWRR